MNNETYKWLKQFVMNFPDNDRQQFDWFEDVDNPHVLYYGGDYVDTGEDDVETLKGLEGDIYFDEFIHFDEYLDEFNPIENSRYYSVSFRPDIQVRLSEISCKNFESETPVKEVSDYIQTIHSFKEDIFEERQKGEASKEKTQAKAEGQKEA